MSRVQYSSEQLKKLGLIETDKGFVKASSLVAKPKDVEKIEPDMMFGKQGMDAQKMFDVYNNTGMIFMETKESFKLPNGELVKIKYSFDINPCPAPRMTRRDAIFLDPEHIDPNKRQRAAVTRYFTFKRTFTWLAQQNGFKLSETLRVVFIVPMPKYWNKNKIEVNLHQPHKQRPDVDNFCKALMDSSGVDDGYVWDVRAIKLWGEKGQIVIF